MEASNTGAPLPNSTTSAADNGQAPAPALKQTSPTPSKYRSSSPRQIPSTTTAGGGPVRNKRTFMACTECRRRQVKCNPSPTPGHPCERCNKRRIKCEYLTRQEQQLQTSNEWDQSQMDSSVVTLRLPEYGRPAGGDPSMQQPPAMYQNYNPGMSGGSRNAAVGDARYSDGAWTLQAMPGFQPMPDFQRQTVGQMGYGYRPALGSPASVATVSGQAIHVPPYDHNSLHHIPIPTNPHVPTQVWRPAEQQEQQQQQQQQLQQNQLVQGQYPDPTRIANLVDPQAEYLQQGASSSSSQW